jgi:NADH-quinone oxidoreductase subunit B
MPEEKAQAPAMPPVDGAESKKEVEKLVFTTRIDQFVKWARSNSMWPMPMGISCCAIEMMAVLAPKYDLSRFGSEVMRFSPRQSDMMIVAGTLTHKMAPVVRRIWEQMSEPKWVIAMGTCLCTGGMFHSYSVVQGLDEVIPVDIYVPGCPPRPENLIDAVTKIQEMARGKVRRPNRKTETKRNWSLRVLFPSGGS